MDGEWTREMATGSVKWILASQSKRAQQRRDKGSQTGKIERATSVSTIVVNFNFLRGGKKEC
jgi:hypothetical protein